MIFRQLFDADSSSYTYLLAAAEGAPAVLIDPVREHTESYLRLLRELGLPLALAVDTHTHADHFSALGALRDATGCRTLMGAESQAACVSGRFADGECLPLPGLSLRALYTPGHTDESYSLVLEEGGVPTAVFTGDALLIRGTGRTDFQGGSAVAAWHSLQKLLALPDATTLYPGHDYKGWMRSSIGEERAHNPRLRVKDAAEYAVLMASLKLPNPRLMDVAVPANLHCGKLPGA